MKNKLLQTGLLFFALCLVACAQKRSSKFDPKEKLDFDHPSILMEETTTDKEVAATVTGTWTGNYDWLNTSNKKGTYKLFIKHEREEFFTITQKRLCSNKEISTQTVNVMLFLIDDKNYVFKTQDGKLIQIHYLSDRQLKLGEYIFVRSTK